MTASEHCNRPVDAAAASALRPQLSTWQVALGVGVVNLINVSDPGRIVVLLLDAGLEEQIVAPCRTALESNTLPALRGRASIQFKFARETNYAQGAATLVLERLYRGG